MKVSCSVFWNPIDEEKLSLCTCDTITWTPDHLMTETFQIGSQREVMSLECTVCTRSLHLVLCVFFIFTAEPESHLGGAIHTHIRRAFLAGS